MEHTARLPPSPARSSSREWMPQTPFRLIPTSGCTNRSTAAACCFAILRRARRAFSFTGDYAKSLTEDQVEGFAFFDESMELSRRFRALKVWLSLRYHGLSSFRQQIQNDLDCANHLAYLLAENAEMELMAPVPLSAVCFRYVPRSMPLSDAQLDELNLRILQLVQRRGRVYFSNATIHGRFALRVCIVNHRTTLADVEEVIDEVLKAGRELSSGALS